MRHLRRITFAVATLLAVATLAEAPVAAKVALITLDELARDAEFIGIVRVETVSFAIPLLFQSHATATVLDRWKGNARRWIQFGSSPTWACDISRAIKGEEAVVFITHRQLLHAGRGRMPIFTRDGRRLARVLGDVRLPRAIVVEDGIVSVENLRDAVRK